MKLSFPETLSLIRKNIVLIAAWSFILAAFIFISITGWLYPLQGDDFAVCSTVRDGKITQYIIYSYMNWTLRTGEIFNMLFSVFDKTVFNIVNPVIQAALCVVLFLCAFRRFPFWRDWRDILSLAAVAGFVLFCTARPRDTVYWMTGANVYAIGSLLWFSLFYAVDKIRKYEEFRCSAWLYTGLFLLGFAASCTLENYMAAGLAAFAILIAVNVFKRKHISGAMWSAFGGYVAGSCVFIASPGRWQRMADAGQAHMSDIASKIKMIPEIIIFWTGSAWFALLIFTGAAAVLFFVDRSKFKKTLPEILLYMAFSITLSAVFIAGGVTPAVRAYMPSALFTVLAAVKMSRVLLETRGLGVAAGNFFMFCVISFSVALMAASSADFIKIHEDAVKRNSVLSGKTIEDEAVVPVHRTVRNSFFQYIWIEDIFPEKSNPFNFHAANYYKVKSIRVTGNNIPCVFWKKIGRNSNE